MRRNSRIITSQLDWSVPAFTDMETPAHNGYYEVYQNGHYVYGDRFISRHGK